MPLTLDGNGTISGLGDIDGHDLETNTLVNISDATFASQAVGRATLFIEESTNTVGINTTTPTATVFLEVADGTDPIVSLNNTANGEVRLGCTATGGYIGTESNHPFNIEANSSTKVTVLSNGNIGINTTSPSALLHIESNAVDAARLRIGFDAPRYYDIFRGSATNSGLLNFYGSQTGFTGYVFGGVDGERLRIASNGNIGIGTTNPIYDLSILARSGSATIHLTNPTVGSTSADGALITSSSSGLFYLENQENAAMVFSTNGSERMRINAGGNLSFPNGQGIDFSASEGAGATSSILDDYEEGTWTAIVGTVDGATSSFTDATTQPGTRTGTYTKTGNVVTFAMWVNGAASGYNNTTDAIAFNGLPYLPLGDVSGRGYSALALWDYSLLNTTAISNNYQTITRTTPGQVFVLIQRPGASITANDIVGSLNIMITGSYFVS